MLEKNEKKCPRAYFGFLTDTIEKTLIVTRLLRRARPTPVGSARRALTTGLNYGCLKSKSDQYTANDAIAVERVMKLLAL